jgi:GntR family transcriptional regulator
MSKSKPKDTRPPHIQVNESLAALLKCGRPGDRLPAEPALAAQLGVSRATLREALRLFAERGLVVRRHGAGTFIAPPRPVIESGMEILESIDRIAGRIGLKTRMDTAVIDERPARPEELQGLGLKSAALVLSIARIIIVGAQPVAHLVDIVPVEHLRKGDLEETFNGSVLDLFLARGKPGLAYSRTDLAAAAADTALAKQLHIQRGAPLLKLVAQLYTQENHVVDYSISHFVPGYFHFHVVRRVGA